MKTYVLQKAYSYKLFMLLAFTLFSSVMYQGHLSQGGIYSILFFASVLLIAFQIASIFYVTFIKRTLELSIDEESISWKFFENKKISKEQMILREDIKDLKTEVNYLTGNFYSSFTITFILNDDKEIVLSDGILYDFGLKRAEDICRFLLDNNLGDEQDIKFAKFIKESQIDLNKEQLFTKKAGKSYFTGVISKHKKEFLSLRMQIEALYKDYKIIEKNANNEYLIKSENIKDSYIHLRSNAFGYFVELYNVSRKEDLKTLKQMGKRNKIGF